jgi:hypothetical protein
MQSVRRVITRANASLLQSPLSDVQLAVISKKNPYQFATTKGFVTSEMVATCGFKVLLLVDER